MEFWVKAAQLILSLSILIVVHELGHFFPAKWFGTRVEKFYLFFDAGFSLFKFKKGETEWGIGWIPLGGYVKISGMIDESMDKEQLEKPAEPWEFRSKPTWQRLIIMVGGVTVNLIVGFFIYMMILFAWGKDYVPAENLTMGIACDSLALEHGFRDGDMILEMEGKPVDDFMTINTEIMVFNADEFKVQHENGEIENIVLPEDIEYTMMNLGIRDFISVRSPAVFDSVVEGRPAQLAGFEEGDKMVSVNNIPTQYSHEFVKEVRKNKNKEVDVVVERDGKNQELSVAVDSLGTIGVLVGDKRKIAKIEHKDYSFLQSIPAGLSHGVRSLSLYVNQMKFLFTKKGATSIGGFGAIGNLFPGVWDWHSFWSLTAFLSFILAFMNILPIPALDGGHVMFLIYEMIAGKAPSDKFLTRAQVVGMVLLLSLLVYANGMDIYRAIFG